ncbi:unnamed protein product, partial [Symbiodinium pilosum]
MAESGTWADERVHLAAARVLLQDVLCISWNPNQHKFYYTVTDKFPDSFIVPVLYNGVNHYDLLEEAALLGQGIVPDHRLRKVRKQIHKTAVRWTGAEEAAAEEGEENRRPGALKTWTTKSMVDGGKHDRILAPTTVQKHVHGYRSLCYFLVQQSLVTEPVTFEEALTKDNLTAYLSHVQHKNTARSTFKAWRTSMVVFVGLALRNGPLGEGELLLE